MKTVKIKLENNNDLKDMWDDLIGDNMSVEEALECVMEEVQLRTIMIQKYPKWAQQYTEIETKGYETVATVQMEKWDNL